MLQYEVTRKQLLDKQQRKIEAMEARAAELQRAKAEHERQWAAAQRERELAKVRGALGCVVSKRSVWCLNGLCRIRVNVCFGVVEDI
jgi:hypothetical protein